MYFYGPRCVLLTQYHKMRALLGVNKETPHTMDAFSRDCLIQLVMLLNPTASLFASILYKGDNLMVTRYKLHLFMDNGHPFDTSTITELCKEYTAR